MGVIAEAIAEFARPLLEQTDGSHEQMSKAFTISQLCFNLAMLSDEDRERQLREMQRDFAMEMDDDEFREFRRDVVDPMIRRHQQMFPRMHRRDRNGFPTDAAKPPAPADRYAPCSCNSGKKYKFCCGKKGR